MIYAHLWHVDGERGEVDYELILGPFEGVQLTYMDLRETRDGERIASLDAMGWWALSQARADRRPFSDVTFSKEKPESILIEKKKTVRGERLDGDHTPEEFEKARRMEGY